MTRRPRLKSVQGAQGAPVADLPLAEEVWEADTVPLPAAAVASFPGAEMLRVAIVAVAGSELVVGTEIGQWDDDGATIADVVLESMRAPMAGDPRRPAAVRVRRTDAARVLADRLPAGVDVEFADTLPAVEAVERGLDEFLAGDAMASPSGLTLDALGNFFDAAAQFYEAAPWQKLDEDAPLEIAIAGAPTVYGIVLGGQGDMHGLALHDSFEQMLEVLRHERDESDMRLIFYLAESDLPPTIAEQRKLRRWRVAGPAAFPVLVRRYANGDEPDPDVDDLRIATAALRATGALASRTPEGDPEGSSHFDVVVEDHEGEQIDVRIIRGAKRDIDRRPPGEAGAGRPGPYDRDENDEWATDLEELIGLITRLPRTRRVFPRLAWTFFRAGEPVHVDEDESDDAMARFSEWAMFAARPGPGQPTLAEQALRREAKRIGPERLARLSALARPRYAVYRITSADGEHVEVLDVLAGDSLRVSIRGTAGPEVGDTIIGNLFPEAAGVYRFGGAVTDVHGELQPDAEPPDQETAAVHAEGDVFGAGPEWILDLDSIDEVRVAWSDFRRALGDAGTPLPTFGALQKQMRGTADPTEVLRQLIDRAWWSFEEAQVCGAFVQRAWELTPRDELGGRSPQRMQDEAQES